MSRLKVAVVGVGALGRHHARIYSEMKSVELVAVVDPSAERGAAVAERCRTRWLPEFNSLPGHVDAVSIAVPTTNHLEVAAPFLERGTAVLVEKPIARTFAEAAAMVDAAERGKAILQVGHVERFNPATRAAWLLVRSPRYLRAERYSPYAFRSTDIGVVLDVMIHDVDLVLDLVNSPVAKVEAFGISLLGENEDCVQARLGFANGCIADLSANRVHPETRRHLSVWSQSGCVSVDFGSRQVVHYSIPEQRRREASPLVLARRPGADVDQLKAGLFGQYIRVARPEVPPSDALTAELDSFVDCVRLRCKPLVDGRAALASMQVADRILKSVSAHRWNADAPGPVGAFLWTTDDGGKDSLSAAA